MLRCNNRKLNTVLCGFSRLEYTQIMHAALHSCSVRAIVHADTLYTYAYMELKSVVTMYRVTTRGGETIPLQAPTCATEMSSINFEYRCIILSNLRAHKMYVYAIYNNNYIVIAIRATVTAVRTRTHLVNPYYNCVVFGTPFRFLPGGRQFDLRSI